MGKLSAILLSFTILFQSFGIEFNDIAKFPTLIKHISCHIEEGDNLANFMDLHYGSSADFHKNKHNEHKQLPFKHHCGDSHFHPVYVLNFSNLEIMSSTKIFEDKNFYYQKTFLNSYTTRFFQPPQK
jgi:hypothetical protein